MELVPDQPGKTFDLAWDGMVHNYEKVDKKCKCYKKEALGEGEYNIKVCALQVTKSARKRTQYVCAESTFKMPGDGPQTLEMEFKDPAPKKKKKKKKRR